MSGDDDLRWALSPREVRAVAAAVARARHADTVGAAARAIAAAVVKAARDFGRSGGAALVCRRNVAIGVSVPVSWIAAGEGLAVTDRVGRWIYLRARKDITLPITAVEGWQITRAGALFVDHHRRQGGARFAELRANLVDALRVRSQAVGAIISSIPPSATREDILSQFSDVPRSTIMRAICQ